MTTDRSTLLRRLDRFLDAVPRPSADGVDAGPLRAFLSRVTWPYYARPRPDLDLTADGALAAADLEAAAAALRTSGAPVAFEWVAQVVPSMASAATEYGLDVTLHPLLVLQSLSDLRPPTGVTIRRLSSDDAAVPEARVVAALAFDPAVAPDAGTDQARAALSGHDPAGDEHARARIRAGLNVTVVAESGGAVIGCGTHQPIEDVTEIVGVAVLPAYRRRGVGAAITAALARDALAGGSDVVMLSAGSAPAARVYESVGFVRVGETGEATTAG